MKHVVIVFSPEERYNLENYLKKYDISHRFKDDDSYYTNTVDVFLNDNEMYKLYFLGKYVGRLSK